MVRQQSLKLNIPAEPGHHKSTGRSCIMAKPMPDATVARDPGGSMYLYSVYIYICVYVYIYIYMYVYIYIV